MEEKEYIIELIKGNELEDIKKHISEFFKDDIVIFKTTDPRYMEIITEKHGEYKIYVGDRILLHTTKDKIDIIPRPRNLPNFGIFIPKAISIEDKNMFKQRLIKLQVDKDREEEHNEADSILCEVLTQMGLNDIVDEYNKISK
jgi:hypothetical protein